MTDDKQDTRVLVLDGKLGYCLNRFYLVLHLIASV